MILQFHRPFYSRDRVLLWLFLLTPSNINKRKWRDTFNSINSFYNILEQCSDTIKRGTTTLFVECRKWKRERKGWKSNFKKNHELHRFLSILVKLEARELKRKYIKKEENRKYAKAMQRKKKEGQGKTTERRRKKKEEKKIMCYRCKSGQHTDLVGVSVIN